MPRPKRPRHIISHPGVNVFGPEGKKAREEIIISLEEFEAIRLIDYNGMDQSGAAEIMNVSRQTVGRILRSGRLKLSKALVDGHRLKVEGGCYKIEGKPYGKRGHGRRQHARGRGCDQKDQGRSGRRCGAGNNQEK